FCSIDFDNRIGTLDIVVNLALSVMDRELRIAAQSSCGDDAGGLGIDERNIIRTGIEYENPGRHRLEHDGVRIGANLDGHSYGLERLQIDNVHIIRAAVAGESFVKLG